MTRAFDKVSVRNLQGVKPELVLLAQTVMDRAPWPIRVTEGLRTMERQRQLLALRVTKTMNSRHLTGHAIDVVPFIDLDRDGKIEAEEMYHHPLYDELIPIAKAAAEELKIKMTFGYDWGWDKPHWELDRRAYPA